MSEVTVTDEQREQVVAAARRHFDEYGWQIDVYRVATAAGVGTEALTGCFGNKAGLALAVYDPELRPLVNAMYEGGPDAALVEFIHGLAGVLVRCPAVAWALQLHVLYPAPDGLVDFDQLADHLSGLIAATRRSGNVVGSMTEIAEGYLFALLGYVSKHPNEPSARVATILLDEI